MTERLRRTAGVVREHPGASVVDIGAGSGRFFKPLFDAGVSKILAIEPAPKMVEVSKKVAKEQGIDCNIEFIKASFLDADVSDKYDISIAIGLYDYIENPLPYLKKMREITNTSMVASFPIAGNLRSKIRSIRLRIRGCPVFFFQ